MLDRTSVLVVEDEPYIALDLAIAIEDAGGRVVGPAGSVAEALALLATDLVDAAILDVNLGDDDICPVVEILTGREVPMLLQTGVGLPSALTERFDGLTVHIKPCDPDYLVREIAVMLHKDEDKGQPVN